MFARSMRPVVPLLGILVVSFAAGAAGPYAMAQSEPRRVDVRVDERGYQPGR